MTGLKTIFTSLGRFSGEDQRAAIASLKEKDSLAQDIQSAVDLKKPLAGHSCFIKDNFDVSGFPTKASSLFLEHVRPGPHTDGQLVQHLHRLGLTIAGKTHMNEFAYGLDGANPHYGNCPHPFIQGACSGGSSSGSAWTVANELVPIAFGTDTGGSIRVPAAFCGLYGFRLPPNTWATDGCFPLAPSYDSAGWFTRTAKDLEFYTAKLLELPVNKTPLRILNSVPRHPFLTQAIHDIFPGAKEHPPLASDQLKQNWIQAFNILQSTEAYAVHTPWLEEYGDQYDPSVKARIIRGKHWTKAEQNKAKAIEQEIISTFDTLFASADVLLVPVSLKPAPRHPMSPESRTELLGETAPASLAKLPVVTIPVTTPEGPLGIQCILPSVGWKDVLSSLLLNLK